MSLNLKAVSPAVAAFLLAFTSSCHDKGSDDRNPKMDAPVLTEQERETRIWELEEKYWEYVQSMDTVAKRKYVFSGDTLILNPQTDRYPKTRLKWVKVNDTAYDQMLLGARLP